VQAEAEALGIRAKAEMAALGQLAEAAPAYTQHPALLRLRELETLSRLAGHAEARIYIGSDKAHGPRRHAVRAAFAEHGVRARAQLIRILRECLVARARAGLEQVEGV
jgi:hypothetical protein